MEKTIALFHGDVNFFFGGGVCMLIVKIFYLSLLAQHHSPLITQDWKNFDITIEYSIWGYMTPRMHALYMQY